MKYWHFLVIDLGRKLRLTCRVLNLLIPNTDKNIMPFPLNSVKGPSVS